MSKLWEGVIDIVKHLMGSQHSQFVTALKREDCNGATHVYRSQKLRDSIKPNDLLSGGQKENTILHYVARLNLYDVYEDMLVNRRARPDQRNNDRQNCLHLICSKSRRSGQSSDIKRKMLEVTMNEGLREMDLKHVLNEKDHEGNTVLHLAARTGLGDCVELLIEKGADLSAVNTAKETPADLATTAGHLELATKLETKIVFEQDDDHVPSMEPDPEALEEIAAGTMGLKDNELRSMKDQLLIETANMLGVPLLTAQVLLRDHDWSKEALLEAWMEDPVQVCEKAGVDMPQELGADHLEHECVSGVSGEDEKECAVCYQTTPPEVVVPCQHHFCKDCWKQYLEDKIKSGESQSICCPEYACYRPVPLGVIENVISQEMARKFLSFDIKAFVDSNPNIRWCPRPNCGQAVTLTTDLISPTDAETQVTVHCGNDHYFCWSCLRGPHDPCSCETWSKWLEHVEEMRPQVGDTTAAEANEAASSRWLADRSKPCPKCSSPIEKTEGCNHMTCKKCKHDFCWMCLDNWRCHNSGTGGYFECNRYKVQEKACALLEKRRGSYYKDARELEAVSRFLHYYERYKEHLNSLALEEPFLDKARDKMQLLANSVRGLEGEDMSFIEEAVRELLKCRRVLQATYPFAYYLSTKKRREFERMQGSLEQATEMMAEVVARPHLRKPRSEIIRLTHEARTKRRMLLDKTQSSQFPRQHMHEDTDSEQEDTDITTFLQLLGEERPRFRSHDPIPKSHDRYREHPAAEDDDLSRAMELSRHEFEADRQLQEDIEKAKAESRVAPEATPTPIPLPPVPMSFDNQTTPTDLDWISRLNSDYEPNNWPILRLRTPPPSPPPTTHTTHTPPSAPPSAYNDEWGPLIGEEEDLEQAIQLSLQQQSGGTAMMDVVGPQVIDSNKLAEDNLYGLPPELLHLLDTKRTGEHV